MDILRRLFRRRSKVKSVTENSNKSRKFHFPFRRIRTISRQMLGLLLLILSAVAFTVIAKNPMPFIESAFPLSLALGSLSLYLDQAQVQAWLTVLYTDNLVLRSSIGIAALTLIMSLLFLVQNPLASIKALGRGIKRSPKAFLYSPITLYRGLVSFRNWMLAKVEYLQAESAKWKTTFAIVKSPFTLLTKMGFSPQMAASLLIGASAVGGGVVVNETVFADRSFANGDSGVYSNGGSDIPTSWTEGDNTLKISLGTVAVKAVTISDVSVGTAFTGSALPSGATTTIDIGGSGVTDTWLHVGTLVFERNRCEVLTLSNISTHTLNITSNASDGQSLSPAAGTIRNRAILGGHGMAQDMSTTGGLYDRVVIEAPTASVNGQIDTLTISNLYTKGGLCRLNRIKAGTVTINLNVIGGDSDLSTKAFTVMADVTASVINLSDNVEVSMAVPATQTIDS